MEGERYLDSFLTSARDGGEWSAGRFTPAKTAPATNKTGGLEDPRDALHVTVPNL
jgi:hypothetical protein